MTRLLGGVSPADSWESLIPGFALAHGDLTCMYPPTLSHPSFTAPVYSIVTAVLSVPFRAGHSVPFPAGAALGPHCAHAYTAITTWMANSGAVGAAQWFAYLAWPVFVVGLVAFLRTTARGLTCWEPVTGVALAATPPVLTTLTLDYHPEDLFCLGLLLASVAALRRERLALAGVVLAAALLSQQFAVLAAIPIVLTLSVPAAKRLVPALAAVLIGVIGVLAIVSHGQVLSSLSTAGDTQYYGEVWIANLHVHDVWLLTLISRGPPIVLVALLSLWARRLATSDSTVPLLIAAGFALRLVFEVNIFGYYFCAVAVALVIADVVAGRVRPLVILWLIMEWLLYNPFRWPQPLNVQSLPFWTSQVALAGSALALALSPLVRSAWRQRVRTPTQPVVAVVSTSS
jgi:hypothetical protein